MFHRALGLGVIVAAGLGLAAAQEPVERQKIEGLIKHIEGLKDAKFVRNDREYDAKAAATFLHRKWQNDNTVKTATDFVEKVASVSSTSGKPYLIRFKDGKETKSGDYLRAELKKLDKPGL